MNEPNAATGTAGQVFELGLVLAGAISAGAYTAGVLDFLFQALDEWEKARGGPGVPQHRVVLKVVTGASAGAITGALGAVALARGLHPRDFPVGHLDKCYPSYHPKHQPFECVLPSLYRTWVELPAMVSADGKGALLGIDDVKVAAGAGVPVVKSLLNAALLDTIKHSAIEPDDTATTVQEPVPYVAQRLHLYVTISNMRGIPFNVAFGRNSYGMQTIGDRIHYVISRLGSHDLSDKTSWVERDAQAASLSVAVTDLPTRRGKLTEQWEMFGTAALASGAFPLGLAARRLDFPWPLYLQRLYPIPVPEGVSIQPAFPQHATQSKSFAFESVDGGLVNNNPFDYAQYALTGRPAAGSVNEHDVDRAIVMVAPFPEPPEFPAEDTPSPAVVAITRALFPALVNQARFRASELAPAVNERDFSRFLIAPLRRIPRPERPASPDDQPPPERHAIACGLLGGFGGFLDEKFRAHDFQLGRRNCQQFLRYSFLVAGDNKIVGKPGGAAAATLPVIPLLGTASDPIPLPIWPKMSPDSFSELCAHTKIRLDAVVRQLVLAQTTSRQLRTALRFGWRAFLRKRTMDFVRGAMLADLVRRCQIEEWEAPSLDTVAAAHGRIRLDVQAVIAELVNPTFDVRTPDGIARRVHLPEPFVTAVLEDLCGEQMPPNVRAWKNDLGYMLFARRPGLVGRQRIVRWVSRWWNAPKVG